MISAGSAVSESSTAPRTDCSASRFCGGASGPPAKAGGWPLVGGALIGRTTLSGPSDEHVFCPAHTAGFPQSCHRVVTNLRRDVTNAGSGRRSRDCTGGSGARLLLLDDHRLDGRDHAVLHLDLDHAGTDRA